VPGHQTEREWPELVARWSGAAEVWVGLYNALKSDHKLTVERMLRAGAKGSLHAAPPPRFLEGFSSTYGPTCRVPCGRGRMALQTQWIQRTRPIYLISWFHTLCPLGVRRGATVDFPDDPRFHPAQSLGVGHPARR